jgi:1-acyl-sn-glycerol-3-phosphate acyltransferase
MNKIVAILSWIFLAPLYHSIVKEARGKENFPKGNFILASNHFSQLDWFLEGYFCIPRRFTFLGQADKMTSGVMLYLRKLLYAYSEIIPVNREDSESKRQAFDSAVKWLKQGRYLFVFPEGTRSRDGKVHKFKPGVARFHLETGVPIVPIAIKGTDKLLPAGGKLKIKRVVVMVAGKPLNFEKERIAAARMDKSSGEYHELCLNITKVVEDRVRELLESR